MEAFRCFRMLLFCLAACVGLGDTLPLPGRKTNYDEATARALLNMAAGAYGDEQQICLNRTFPPYEMYYVISSTTIDCDGFDNTCGGYTAASDVNKELTFVFRGTKTTGQLLLEGLQAIDHGVEFFDLGTVNKYFMNGLLVLWPQVEETLTNPKFADYKITFTGHSLGGALAALAAARTAKQGLRSGDQITMYTFGEPRVGDVTFAKNFDSMIKNSYRVVFHQDIVPHLPPCNKDKTGLSNGDGSRPCDSNDLSKPYHHGTEIWYPDSMAPGAQYIECVGEPSGEDFACSDALKFHYDQDKSYISDHRHYFSVRVPPFGEAGCDPSLPEGKPSK